jgi:hypothetical protein
MGNVRKWCERLQLMVVCPSNMYCAMQYSAHSASNVQYIPVCCCCVIVCG